jgi:hypothetical protein
MPKPPTRVNLERLRMLSPEEQQRLLALHANEQAELNDAELNAEINAENAKKAKEAQKARNGLTAEKMSEILLGLGGKRTKRKTYRKRHSRRSRHAR